MVITWRGRLGGSIAVPRGRIHRMVRAYPIGIGVAGCPEEKRCRGGRKVSVLDRSSAVVQFADYWGWLGLLLCITGLGLWLTYRLPRSSHGRTYRPAEIPGYGICFGVCFLLIALALVSPGIWKVVIAAWVGGATWGFLSERRLQARTRTTSDGWGANAKDRLPLP